VSRLLGRRLPPWAAHAVTVAGELVDGTDRHAYNVVVVTVPRQSSKTTAAFAVGVGRGESLSDHRAAYMAQAGVAMVRKFRSDLFRPLESSVLRPRWKVRRGAGDPGVEHRHNGSFMQGFPPADGVLRGQPFDLVIVDEAQEVGEDLGDELDATIMPTFQTRPRRQLWLLGTAPDAEHAAAYFRRYYDLARAGTPGMCLFDWGVGDDEDPMDPRVWMRRHPGLGHLPGADVEFLEFMRGQIPGQQFVREFGNVWPDPASASRATPIPLDRWNALAAPTVTHGPDRTLAFDVTVDRTHATLAGASQLDDLVPVEVLWSGPAADLDTAVLAAMRPGVRVVAGPHQSETVGRLTASGADTAALTAAEYVAACQRFADLVLAGRVAHTADPSLTAALTAAARSWRGDAWTWSARGSDADITPLVAVTLAAAEAATRTTNAAIY